MAYYKVLIEVWCDWDPEASALEEIVENISAGDRLNWSELATWIHAPGWPVKTTIRQKNSIPQKIYIFCHGGLTQFVINPHTAVEQPAHLGGTDVWQ